MYFNNFNRYSTWAEVFGAELWDLGKRMTKSSEIKSVMFNIAYFPRYKDFLRITLHLSHTLTLIFYHAELRPI